MTCDAATEFCQVDPGAPFLLHGNPDPFGASPSSTCAPLPERCLSNVSCACLTCDEDVPEDQSTCVFDACSEDEGLLQTTPYTA